MSLPVGAREAGKEAGQRGEELAIAIHLLRAAALALVVDRHVMCQPDHQHNRHYAPAAALLLLPAV